MENLDKIDKMEKIGVNGKDKINKDDEFHIQTYYNYKTVSENRDGNKGNSNLEFFKKKRGLLKKSIHITNTRTDKKRCDFHLYILLLLLQRNL